MSNTPDPVILTMMSASDFLQACTDACAGWQQEIARFADLRLVENRRSWEALMAARDVAGVAKVQQEWSLKMAADYTQEAARFSHLLSTLSLTGSAPALRDAGEAVA